MPSTRQTLTAAGLTSWILASGCAGPSAQNLVLISFDTTRADRLSAYGHPSPTSPTVEGLASRGTLFENAYSHTPSTLPAHASLFTGLLPPGHGVRSNGRFRLSEDHVTLAELLAEQGFETGAFTGALPMDRQFGLDQGFDVYDGDFASQGEEEARGEWLGHPFESFERSAEQVTDRALAWLRERSAERRWFLFVHYFDPHLPHTAPEPWTQRFADPYDAEIAYADHHLARLLEAVASRPGKTLVVFTADHGEGLGEHGEKAHNRYLYNSTIRVPLIFALEGHVRAGGRISTPVAHVDVLPTLLELLGVPGSPSPAPHGGRSLAAALAGTGEPEPRPIYSESLEWKLGIAQGIVVRAVVDGHLKLVQSDVEKDGESFAVMELYDLETDPSERANLARHETEQRERLVRDLAAWSGRMEAQAFPPEGYDLDEKTLEGLRSLGYLQ